MTYRSSTALLTVLAMAMAAPALAGDMTGNHFTKVDANADAQVDFTEFYNYVSQYGYSDADAAQEFVRLAGPDNMITSDGFAGYDASAMKDKYAASEQPAYDTTSQTSYQSAETSSQQPATVMTYRNDQMVVLGRTSVSGDFASYDANSDGLVNYKEYAKIATNNGVSNTAAAREFIQISGGQAQFDENAFNMIQYTSAPVYQSDQGQYQQDDYVAPTTPEYTGETTTSYESDATSGAYTEPATPTYEGETSTTYDSGTIVQPDTEYSSDTSSGAYAPAETDMTIDPTVGTEVETDNAVEETWEKTKDVTSDAWDATKDAASDTMEKAEEIVDPDQ